MKLPVTMEKDKITLTNAQLETPQSKVVISGELDNLAAPTPHSSAHINASISLDEARRVAGLDIPLDLRAGPQFVTADITAAADDKSDPYPERPRRTWAPAASRPRARSKSRTSPGNVQFNATLALNELGRLLKVARAPGGHRESRRQRRASRE